MPSGTNDADSCCYRSFDAWLHLFDHHTETNLIMWFPDTAPRGRGGHNQSFSLLSLTAQFSVPWLEFAAEYKVVMFTSCCKFSWGYYCDANLCYCDVIYHGSMQRARFVWNTSTICHHNSSTITGGIHDYWPLSRYSVWGTKNWPTID